MQLLILQNKQNGFVLVVGHIAFTSLFKCEQPLTVSATEPLGLGPLLNGCKKKRDCRITHGGLFQEIIIRFRLNRKQKRSTVRNEVRKGDEEYENKKCSGLKKMEATKIVI